MSSNHQSNDKVYAGSGLYQFLKDKRAGKVSKVVSKSAPQTLPEVDINNVFVRVDAKEAQNESKETLIHLGDFLDDVRHDALVTVKDPTETKKVQQFFTQPFTQVIPHLGSARVIAKVDPQALARLKEKWIFTDGTYAGVMERLVNALPRERPKGREEFVLEGDSVKNPQKTMDSLKSLLPIDPAEMKVLNDTMTQIREFALKGKDVEELQAKWELGDGAPPVQDLPTLILDRDVIKGSSLGIPYIWDYKDAVHGGNPMAEQAALVDATAILHAMATLSVEEFSDWLADDVKTNATRYWALMKRKLDRYSVQTWKEKIRPYYVYNAGLVMALKPISDILRHVIRNCQEDSQSYSAYGCTMMYGGGSRFVQVLKPGSVPGISLRHEHGDTTEVRGFCFSDDELESYTFIDGQKSKTYIVESDMSGADMTYVQDALDFEFNLYYPHILPINRAIFNNFWRLLSYNMYQCVVVLGRKWLVRKMWGLSSGHIWTTLTGIVNHSLYHAREARYIHAEVAKLGHIPNKVEFAEILARAPQALHTRFRFKTAAVAELDDDLHPIGGVYGHFCGMTLSYDKTVPGHVKVSMETDRLLYGLMQPHRQFKDEQGNTVVRARMLGIWATTGWQDPKVAEVVEAMDKIYRVDLVSNEGDLLSYFPMTDYMWDGGAAAVMEAHGALPGRAAMKQLLYGSPDSYRQALGRARAKLTGVPEAKKPKAPKGKSKPHYALKTPSITPPIPQLFGAEEVGSVPTSGKGVEDQKAPPPLPLLPPPLADLRPTFDVSSWPKLGGGTPPPGLGSPSFSSFGSSEASSGTTLLSTVGAEFKTLPQTPSDGLKPVQPSKACAPKARTVEQDLAKEAKSKKVRAEHKRQAAERKARHIQENAERDKLRAEGKDRKNQKKKDPGLAEGDTDYSSSKFQQAWGDMPESEGESESGSSDADVSETDVAESSGGDVSESDHEPDPTLEELVTGKSVERDADDYGKTGA